MAASPASSGCRAQLPQSVIEADIVAPGLIDLQENGGFGVEVGHDPEAFRRLAAQLPATGVTGFLPTVVSSPPEFYPPIYEAFDAARAAPGAQMLGLHIEGPFLSPQRIGAHRREVVEGAQPALIEQFLLCGEARVVTLAPESSRTSTKPLVPGNRISIRARLGSSLTAKRRASLAFCAVRGFS
jgi:N-acetylglucosamine-6-phosphate deacetylase